MKVKFRTQNTKKRKVFVNDVASKLFNQQIGNLDDKYN